MVSLLTDMRTAELSAPTRPHPAAPHSRRAGRLAAAVNVRIDRTRDVLDNRST